MAPLALGRAHSRTSRASCPGGEEPAVQTGDPDDLDRRRPRRDQLKLTLRLLRITGHPQQGARAPRVTESKRSQIHDHGPGAAIYDIPDVADRDVAADDIQLAAQIYDNLATSTEPVAQSRRRRFLHILFCPHRTSSRTGLPDQAARRAAGCPPGRRK